MRKSAPKLTRLTKRAEFQAAAGDGRRFRSSALTVQVLDRDVAEDGAGVRVGLTASRKTGTATERNRIRRRLRAAAREAFAHDMAAIDVVAVARADVLKTPYGELVRTLAAAPAKARPQRKPGNGPTPPDASRGHGPSRRQETQRS